MVTVGKILHSLAFVAGILLSISTKAAAYSVDKGVSRRSLGTQALRRVVAGTVLANTLASSASPAVADDELVDVYFGVGCFWHIQHEAVEAERR